MVDVLKKIYDLRQERGWSIYKLAEESMLTQSTISNMYTRKTLPSLTSLNQICDAFGITLSEFFDEKTNDTKEQSMLYFFRKLNEKDKNTVINLAQFLTKS